MLEDEQNIEIKRTGWTSFFGILAIIFGGLYSLTIIGAVIGVPVLLVGLKLTKAASLTKEFASDNNVATAKKALNQFLNAFKIYGIIMIVAFGIWLITMTVLVILGVTEII